MTMQVAMVGRDGIVVASDKRHSKVSGKARQTFDSSKFKLNDDKTIAIFYAKSSISTIVARRILRELDNPADPRQEMERIGEEVIEKDELKLESEVLLVTSKCPSSVFHLHITRDLVQCDSVKDKIVTGDHTNAAVFFSERYYKRAPIRQLALLSAHIVSVGSKLNPAGISGLDIVSCDRTGIKQLPERLVSALWAKSKQIDHLLGRRLGLS